MLGVAAVAALALALLARLASLVAVAVALLGAEYALLLALDGGPLDTRAAFVAAALYGVAELAAWALDLREAVADEPGMVLRRVALLAALGVATVVLGLGLLALVEAAGEGGRTLEAVGVVAAVGALALLALAARSGRSL